MANTKYFFVDLDCGGNLSDGLPHYAAGIVADDHRVDRQPSLSGKDLAVSYIDPWGDAQHAWRSISEVRLIEADEIDYAYLKDRIDTIEKSAN